MIDNLKKYKRLFTFGCSYSQHIYPCWTDVLSKEIPDSEFYSCARPGAGNFLIAASIAEANARYRFTEDDLIIVMWTAFCREDRYIGKAWERHGNVFNNNFYDDNFIKKYADPNGYLIKSFASIALTDGFLKSSKANHIMLTAYPFSFREMRELYDETYCDILLNIYDYIWKNFPPSLMEVIGRGLTTNEWHTKGATYKHLDGTNFKDAHPNAMSGFQYLKEIGFPLTELSFKYAKEETDRLKSFSNVQEIYDYYHEYYAGLRNKVKDIF